MIFKYIFNFDLWKLVAAVVSIALTALCILIAYLYGTENLFDRFQNYIFASVALLAAFVTLVGIEKQILEQTNAQNAVNEQRLKASKIALFLPLNRAHLELGNAAKQLAGRKQEDVPLWNALNELIKAIAQCIEFENEDNAKTLAKLCETIQVLNARYELPLNAVSKKQFPDDQDEFKVGVRTYYRSEIIVAFVAEIQILSALISYARLETPSPSHEGDFRQNLLVGLRIYSEINLEAHPLSEAIHRSVERASHNASLT